jgi:pimeloyl-ACP methyl ester carboxylesterase
MPYKDIRNTRIHYEIVGSSGDWVALTPGGRLGLDHVRGIANQLAAGGYRVLIHDRRNCGDADVLLGGDQPEHEIWTDDLHELLKELNALPIIIGGRSSGCRLSLIFALKYPTDVRALLLWRITGGTYAAEKLAYKYYGEYSLAAAEGGMAAVCATPQFAECIKARPENRQKLLDTNPQQFIESMNHWSSYFQRDAEKPVIGASEEQLRSIQIPACIVPGNDKIHSRAVGTHLSTLLPHCELHTLFTKDYDVDMSPNAEWVAKNETLATLFMQFLQKVLPR